ncbi:MAG TPA: hypothetical protein VEI05_03820 [Burkholderiaceae bacterium]|nr:hypothetical protein [Burkholderiaceae bacterium]
MQRERAARAGWAALLLVAAALGGLLALGPPTGHVRMLRRL